VIAAGGLRHGAMRMSLAIHGEACERLLFFY
jgi:hypothetical protein